MRYYTSYCTIGYHYILLSSVTNSVCELVAYGSSTSQSGVIGTDVHPLGLWTPCADYIYLIKRSTPRQDQSGVPLGRL